MGPCCHELDQTGTEISDQRNIRRDDQMTKNFQKTQEGLPDRFFQYVYRDMKPVFNAKTGTEKRQPTTENCNGAASPGLAGSIHPSLRETNWSQAGRTE